LVQNEEGGSVEGVSLEIIDLEDQLIVGTDLTEIAGDYLFEDLTTCEHFQVRPEKDYNYSNGVSTFDLVLITKHILQSDTLDSPYKIIAADANHSGAVSATDLIDLRKVILTLQDTFTSNTSWRFVPNDYTFADPNQPLADDFPETMEINYFSEDMQIDFVGIKVGDVNNSANPSAFNDADSRNEVFGTLIFNALDQEFESGENITVAFDAKDLESISGFQFTLNYDNIALEFENIIPGALNDLTQSNFGIQHDKNAITISWNSELVTSQSETVFLLQFKTKNNGKLSDALHLDSRLINAEAYNRDLEFLDVQLQFREAGSFANFELFQNQPNPFANNTTISFSLPESGFAEIKIFDLAGREIKTIQGEFAKGYNSVNIDRSEVNSVGLLYYQLNSEFGNATKKMILVDNNN